MPTLNLEKLLRVPYVDPYGGVEFSPDGARIAFSWNRTGQWEIYEVLLDESPPTSQDELSFRQVSKGSGAKFSPHYSPDGSHLVYVLDLDGSEWFDIIVCRLDDGAHTNLTPDSPYAIQPNLCWSPDGSQIAYIADQAGHFDTYILPLSGGEPRLVLGLPNPDWDVKWSPNGHWLAVVTESQAQDFTTFLVPVGGGEPKPIAVDGKSINAKQVCWYPDSKSLAFSSDYRGNKNPDGYYNIGLYDLASEQITWLTSGEGDKVSPDWSPDGNNLAYVSEQGPDTRILVQKLKGGESRSFQVQPGVHYEPRFSPDSKWLAFIFGNPCLPEDLWLISVHSLMENAELVQDSLDEKNMVRQLTRSLPKDLPSEAFVMPTHIQYPSLDGKPVPALLFQPKSVTDAASAPHLNAFPPAVVVIHGGPNWLYQYLWYPIFQHMVSRGWVVLAPNYRGSTCYGREWQLANRYEMGRADAMDVVAGVDYLLEEGLADPKRIAVTGRSHGGYLTMCCLTQYPDYWAGGSAVVPFLNWFTSHANSRQDLQHWDIENMGDPNENQALWRERSPFFFLDRVRAPVQLICGANDPRCPPGESIAARDELLALGKEVDFVLYPDEGHGFLKIENIVDHELRRMDFIKRILEP